MREKTGFRSVKEMTVADLDWHAEKHDGLWMIDDPQWHERLRLDRRYDLPFGADIRMCPIAVADSQVAMVEWRPEGSVAGISARLAYDISVAKHVLEKRKTARQSAEKSLKEARAEEERELRRLELLQKGMPRAEQMESRKATLFIDLGFLDDEDVRREALRRGLIQHE